MELWDLYNKDGQLTNETVVRGQTLPPNRYHLVIHFWIRNSKGEYFIQKRSNKVTSKVGIWAFTGGSVLKGENSLQGLQREVQEEIGYTLNPEEVKKIYQYYGNNYKVDVYVLQKDVPLNAFYLGDEVEEITYATPTQITQLQKQGKFWDLDDTYMKTLFGVY